MFESSVPTDYRLLDRNSRFSDHTGPYYLNLKDQSGVGLTIGMRIQEKHLNNKGVTHGGALMTLADNAVGDAATAAFDEPVSVITVSMNTDFISFAKLGDWVEAEARILKKGGRLVFADCLLSVQGRAILQASAVMSWMKT